MKKWWSPIFIILVCIGLIAMLITPFTNMLISYKQKKIDFNAEKERSLAYDTEAVYEENTSKIKDIKCGSAYTVVLKEDGTVWVTGENYYVSDIIKKSGTRLTKFTKMKLENIIQIAVGDNFVLALDSNGEIYSWGGNTYNQLGIKGIRKKCYDIPQKLDLKDIEKIYANGEQSSALSKTGEAYYWGYATDTTNGEIIKEFNIDKVSDIFMAFHKIYFKTINDEVYGVGFDFDGITNQVNGWAREPEKIEIQDVKEIVSGQGYIYNIPSYQDFVIKNDGTVSILNVHDDVLETKIEELKDIVKIKTFEDNNKQSALFLDINGNVYTNKENSLHGSLIPMNYKKLDISNVKDIVVSKEAYALWSNIILIKDDNTIWNLGGSINNFEHKEGAYSNSYCNTPEQINIENVKNVDFGEEYIIVVDNNDKLYRKGYNSVGQLGEEKQENISELDLLDKSKMYQEEINNEVDTSVYGTTPNEEEPYWTELEDGKYILIDPAMTTMAD